MKTDHVFPEKNELKFVRLAEKLGYEKLVFVYSMKNYNQAKLEQLKNKTKLQLETAVFCNENQIQEAKKTSEKVVVKSSGERTTFEQGPSIIFGLEENPRKDSLHFRNSGLNQVTCKIARDKNITIAVSFSDLLRRKNKPILLGRIIQNKRFCSKYDVNFEIYSLARNHFEMRSWHDLESFRKIL
ncbi:MAG TPA: hypothetical protein VI894_03990 [Candidatus Nanoarchaeia archaeon]|nr:hypothetical protein [Candidatus Nanoarchaeia archaeon]